MTKIYELNECPENSLISKDLGRVDYCDSYMIIKNTDDSIDKITSRIFKFPHWVDYLLNIRHRIVAHFGLMIEENGKAKELDYYPVGSRAIHFTVLDRNDHEIVMAEDDKHLYFRTAVMKKQTAQGTAIYLTTIVKYHNIGGRIYFLPVKPFHKIIMRSLLKGL